MDFQNPILTVDVVLLTLAEGQLQVALMPRTEPPFAGRAMLPGGYVHGDPATGKVDKSTTHAALRILQHKLGFTPRHLEQVYTESGPSRDPRGWSASVIHLALHEPATLAPLVAAGRVTLHPVHPQPQLPPLAFDHRHLIELALGRLRAKATYSTLLAHLLPPVFRPLTRVIHEGIDTDAIRPGRAEPFTLPDGRTIQTGGAQDSPTQQAAGGAR